MTEKPPHLDRWSFIALFWCVQGMLLYVGFGWWALDVDSFGELIRELIDQTPDSYGIIVGGTIITLTVLQAMFLAPVRKPTTGGAHAASMTWSLAIGGFVVSLLAAGVAMAVGEMADPSEALLNEDTASITELVVGAAIVVVLLLTGPLLLVTLRKRAVPVLIGLVGLVAIAIPVVTLLVIREHSMKLHEDPGVPLAFVIAPVAMLTSWGVATPLLIALSTRRPVRREERLRRLAVWLFTGTLVETAAVIPLDIVVRRRESCHCATGTFWALTFCALAGVFTLGPMILLTLMTHRRKSWYAHRCVSCGYDLSANAPDHACPECGDTKPQRKRAPNE